MPSVSNKNGTLHYSNYGKGKKALLAFHGYDQDHTLFNTFASKFTDIYTTFSIDIFFHGKSSWTNDDQPLSKVQWKDIILLLLKQEQIGNFSTIGFSMGGKFALTTMECFPKRCDKILLLAPDGIKMNFWYKVITKSLWARRLFRFTIKSPTVYHQLSKMAVVFGLAPKKLTDFADTIMRTEKSRAHVYFTWVVFRHLYVSSKKIKSIMNQFGNDLDIFVGNKDVIITPEQMQKMTKSIERVKIHRLNSGHGKLIDETIQYIHSHINIIE